MRASAATSHKRTLPGMSCRPSSAGTYHLCYLWTIEALYGSFCSSLQHDASSALIADESVVTETFNILVAAYPEMKTPKKGCVYGTFRYYHTDSFLENRLIPEGLAGTNWSRSTVIYE